MSREKTKSSHQMICRNLAKLKISPHKFLEIGKYSFSIVLWLIVDNCIEPVKTLIAMLPRRCFRGV
jgi:hypothetical protein